MHGQDDVRFDYDGALNTARELWVLADSTDTFKGTRKQAAEDATADWQGPLKSDFVSRVETERQGLTGASNEFRSAARMWAKNWADAVNETNRRRRARKVTEIRNSRWFGEQVWDGIFGDDSEDQVRAATKVTVPQAPGFAATGGLDEF